MFAFSFSFFCAFVSSSCISASVLTEQIFGKLKCPCGRWNERDEARPTKVPILRETLVCQCLCPVQFSVYGQPLCCSEPAALTECAGDVHGGGREVLSGGAGSGLGPPAQPGHHLPGPQAREVSRWCSCCCWSAQRWWCRCANHPGTAVFSPQPPPLLLLFLNNLILFFVCFVILKLPLQVRILRIRGCWQRHAGGHVWSRWQAGSMFVAGKLTCDRSCPSETCSRSLASCAALFTEVAAGPLIRSRFCLRRQRAHAVRGQDCGRLRKQVWGGWGGDTDKRCQNAE